MRVKLFFIIVVIVVSKSVMLSQDIENIYFPGNDTDKAYSICKSDANYLICGSTRSISIGNNDVILFELTESGNVNWMKVYDIGNSEEAFDVCASESGKIGIVGYTWAGAFLHNPFIYILGETGQIEKEEYINDNMSGICFSIIEDNNGGFSYSGYTAERNAVGGQVFLTKMDNQDTIIWEREYGDTPEENIFSHIQTQDKGYLLVGTKDGFMFNFIWREFWTSNSNIYIIKTDSNGNQEWDKIISGKYHDLAKCVKQAPDGGYYILGSTQNLGLGSFDMYLIKISVTGELEWEKTFGGLDFEYGYDMCITEDNYLYLSGVSKTAETESVDTYIVKTDLEGNVVWENFYGNSGSDYAYGIESTSTNGCMVVGTTNDENLGNGSYNLLIMKLDSDGKIDELLNVETAKMPNISIFPNPAYDSVNIKIVENDNSKYIYSLKVIDVYGKEVHKQNINDKSLILNTSKYEAGVYFIEITINNNKKYIKKLVIQGHI